MTLITSISGIRGTIGGKPGEGLSPVDVVKFTAAFICFIKDQNARGSSKVVIGRDARVSGKIINSLVSSTIQSMGFDVIDLGLSTTPTVEIAVTEEKADAGIIITASHNPGNWNALKLLNNKGEFISAEDGEKILDYVSSLDIVFAGFDDLGKYEFKENYIEKHIQKVLDLPLVDAEAIKRASFTVAVDGINSIGGVAMPLLLKALGVSKIIEINCEPDGRFAHNPEPIPQNLNETCSLVLRNHADLGIVVDPDVDRLSLITEKGEMFGEEYTLVAVADYILQNKVGNTVSNLSSTQALRDVTEKAGGNYFASAVGEVNVVEMMKQTNAVVGGEGNGGIIYPDLHYGRDALVGVALFLSHLAKSGLTVSELRKKYPDYYMSKNKVELSPGMDIDFALSKLRDKYNNYQVIDIDGLKIIFGNEWVHLRKSNTEPIIRIYAESETMDKADQLANQIINDIKGLIKNA